MKLIYKKIQKSFDKNANKYDDYCEIQKIVADLLIKNISQKQFNDILEIGTGTGLFTEKLIDKIIFEKLILSDFSKKMMLLSKTKFLNKNIDFLCMDALNFSLKKTFDLIVSNASYQWINNLEKHIKRQTQFLNKNGMLAITYFGNQTFFELNSIINKYFKTSIPASKFLEKEKLKQIFKNNFSEYFFSEYKIIKKYSNLMDFLRTIKNTGEYGFGIKKNKMITKNDILKLEKLYFKRYKKIKVTYNIYVLKGKKY